MKKMMLARLSPTALWWRRRAPRERAMLVLMVAAIAAFVAWYGVLVPLRQAHDDARARHLRAAAELARVQVQLAQLAELEQRFPARPGDREALEKAVRASAAQAGFPIGQARDDGDGSFGVRSEAATPAQLFAWLDALREQHGLAPAALSVARNQDRLRVQASFQHAPP